MSDSKLSPPPSNAVPSDSVLRKALRDAVSSFYENDASKELTVNNVRIAAEQKLGLNKGFFKIDAQWKKHSSTVIKEEVERHNALPSSQPEPSTDLPPTPPKPTKPSQFTASKAKKRSSPDAEEPRAKKKSKKSASVSESDDNLSSPPTSLSEEEEKPQKRKGQPAKKVAERQPAKNRPSSKTTATNGDATEKSDSDLSSAPESDVKAAADAEDPDSEMSEVIDEPTRPQKRGPKLEKPPKDKAQRRLKTNKSVPSPDLSPDDAEIKRLQGWLVKCGIRKLWGKELKPYETSKAKIKHLRQMLEDAGMKGRFSMEKAREIKERRELAADIEAVKEGAERWGKAGGEDDESGGGKPKRRLVRGAKNYDFLSGSDGEETD
ncbi:MAG: hypothetical protein Q9227_001325 [Pyrenula ochraceoflavens]